MISQEMSKIDMSMKIIKLRLQLHILGTNDLLYRQTLGYEHDFITYDWLIWSPRLPQ